MSARENCRTVRDILPLEAWQYLTELQLYVEDNLQAGLTRKGRYEFLDRIIRGCQMTLGLLGSVMTRDVGYQFLRLGRNLERADMTTRFIDMRLTVPQSKKRLDPTVIGTVQWVNVLESLSAYQMFRRKMQARVQREHVLWFLFMDDEFPRFFMHCLNAVKESLGTLDNNRPCLLAVRQVIKDLDQTDVQNVDTATLGVLVDCLQRGLMDVHATVARMYFLPPVVVA